MVRHLLPALTLALAAGCTPAVPVPTYPPPPAPPARDTGNGHATLLADDALAALPTRPDGAAAGARMALPAERVFWCDYVAAQIADRLEHGGSVTDDERAKMTEILNGCPAQTLPNGPRR